MTAATATAPAGLLSVTEGTTLMTIDEVADHLRVPVLTIRWLRQEGRFAPAIKVGRRLVWDARDVAAWVESNREVAA